MSAIEIYTDGGSVEGDGEYIGGYGVFFSINGKEWGHSSPGGPNCTNNMAELKAYLNALEVIEKREFKGASVFLDSRYVLDNSKAPLARWAKNGYITTIGEPVKNKELWDAIDKQQQILVAKGLMPELIKVKGHSGNRGNDEADALATFGIKNSKQGMPEGITVIDGLLTEPKDNVVEKPAEKKPKVKVAPPNPFMALDRVLDVTHSKQAISHDGRFIYMMTEFPKQSKSDDEDEDNSKRKKAEAKTRNCGHLIPDSCISVALLKEECAIYREIRDNADAASPRTAAFPYLVEWSQVATAKQWEKFNTLPFNDVVRHYRPNLYLYKDGKNPEDKKTTQQFTYFLAVPRLARDAIEYCTTLLGVLDDYSQGTLEEHPIDITDMFFNVTDKGKRTIKKNSDFGRAISVTVDHRGKTVPITLAIGSDLPKLLPLMRILKQSPNIKIRLIKRVQTPVSFRVSTVFEDEEDMAIFSGPATSIHLVP